MMTSPRVQPSCRGRNADSSPEQWLVIKPRINEVTDCSELLKGMLHVVLLNV